MQVKDLAETKRMEKLDNAKNAVIEEMRMKLEALGLSFDEVMGKRRKRASGQTLPVKYRGPNGETWSGRGFAPQWLRALEDEGKDREDYRIEKTS